MILKSILIRLEAYDEVIGSTPKGWRSVLKKAGGASFVKSLPRKNAEKLLNQALKQVLKENKSSEKPKEIDIPKTYINEWLNNKQEDTKILDKKENKSEEKVLEYKNAQDAASIELTENELKEFSRYAAGTGPGGIEPAFQTINSALRQGKKIPPEYENIVKTMDKAFKRSSITAPIQVYRGVSGDFAKQLKIGLKFIDKGFTSTTTEKSIARNFSKDFIMEIMLPKGTQAIDMRKVKKSKHFGNEYEILVNRNSKFKVVDMYGKNPTTVIVEAI